MALFDTPMNETDPSRRIESHLSPEQRDLAKKMMSLRKELLDEALGHLSTARALLRAVGEDRLADRIYELVCAHENL